MKTSPDEPSLDVPGRLGAAVRAWDRFWFSPTDPTTLCFMRICAGIVLLYVHISYSFDLMSYVHPHRAWTDESVINYVRKVKPFEGPRSDWIPQSVPVTEGQYYWSVFFHLYDDHWIWLAHLTIVGCTLLFTLGLWTRVTTVLTWAGALCYIERATNMMFGMDTMTAIALSYLMIGPAGALSLDHWLAVRRARRLDPGAIVPVKPSIGANLAIRMFQIHFCFIYGASGLSKLQGAAWWNGTALWACMANYNFAPLELAPFRSFLSFLCDHRLLWELFMSGSVLFTLVMEIGFPFLIWIRRFRWLMVCGALLLHFGIGTLMGLVGFSMLMIVLLTSFVPPEVVRRQLDRFFHRRRAAQAPMPPLSAPVESRPEALAVAGRS